MDKDNENPMPFGGIEREIIIWVVWFVVALLISIIVNGTLIVNAGDESGSMETAIMSHARVVALRTAYSSKEPERFDIVVFKNPVENGGELCVRRIIGLPNDAVNIVDGKVYVNKTPLDESAYLSEEMKGSFGPYFVPQGSYFMLGDKRNSSKDSREWGFVQKKDIVGKVVFNVYPNIKSIK